MSTYLLTNDYFKVRFFVVDTLVNPTNDNAIVNFLEKNLFLSFTSDTGTVGYINFAQVTLETDTSLLLY